MKKILFSVVALGAAGLLIFILLSTIAQAPGRRVANWQSALEDYLAYKRQAFKAHTSIANAVQAQNPNAFTEGQRLTTYSDTAYYDIDNSYRHASTKTFQIIAPTDAETSTLPFPPAGKRPLPYPPEELWCVRLTREIENESSLVFVALHQDLYGAAWVVHVGESAPFSQGFVEQVAALGCALELGD